MGGKLSTKSDATKTIIPEAYAIGGTLKIAADVAGIHVGVAPIKPDTWQVINYFG